jgi:hypothetical protein
MPLAGRQLSIASALAACRAAGWYGEDLITAVCVMSAESARYTKAYNINYPGSAQESIDRGVFQINDKAHPEVTEDEAYNAAFNVKFSHRMWRDQGFKPWAAYNSGNHLQFTAAVRAVYDRGTWRIRVPLWQGRMALL